MGEDSIFIGSSAGGDLVYVPAHLAREFSELAEIFWDERVHLEIAVPTIIYGLLTSKREVEELNGDILWGKDRQGVDLILNFCQGQMDGFLQPKEGLPSPSEADRRQTLFNLLQKLGGQ